MYRYLVEFSSNASPWSRKISHTLLSHPRQVEASYNAGNFAPLVSAWSEKRFHFLIRISVHLNISSFIHLYIALNSNLLIHCTFYLRHTKAYTHPYLFMLFSPFRLLSDWFIHSVIPVSIFPFCVYYVNFMTFIHTIYISFC